MYVMKNNPKYWKNNRDNDDANSRSRFNCSCPKKFPFKYDQSKCNENINISCIKVEEESDSFLSNGMKLYGSCSKLNKPFITRHCNSPTYANKVIISSKCELTNNTTCLRKNNGLTSKTEPYLKNDRYVEDLKKEIKSKKSEIPSLPDEYRTKYLKSLKDEIALCKITICQDKGSQIEEIKKEIESYRDYNAPFLRTYTRPDYLSDIQPQPKLYHEDKKRNNLSATNRYYKKKEKKGQQSESGDKVDRKPKHKKNTRKTEKQKKEKDVDPIKEFATIATQCDLETIEKTTVTVDKEVVKKLDFIHDIFPRISSVIEETEKRLEKVLESETAPIKTVQDRGVSPIKDIVEMYLKENIPKDEPLRTSPEKHNIIPEGLNENGSSGKSSPTTFNPHVGDLLINIQNIKDTRCLLKGFQKELNLLQKDIQNCCRCHKGSDLSNANNFCQKHIVYIPLLRMREEGSISDQVNLFSVLKTEVYLKKQIENQIKYIEKLKKSLRRAKRENDFEKVDMIAKELELAQAYYEKLSIKQQNERLLNELQTTLNVNSHECEDLVSCTKCCLQRQIYDLLTKVRENIGKEIEDTKQRLQVQKMPSIDIRKPLQVQNMLNLDIPPSTKPMVYTRSNFTFETVIKDGEQGSGNRNEGNQTNILVNKTTSIEVPRSEDKKTEIPSKLDKEVKRVKSNVDLHQTWYQSEASKIQNNLEKTPSQLGFRRNVETQCSSKSSLIEFTPYTMQVPAVSEHTQTLLNGRDSNFLFGFKEYLMTKPGDGPSTNSADANLQVNIEGSATDEVERRSIGVNTDKIEPEDDYYELHGSIAVSMTPELDMVEEVDREKKSTDSEEDPNERKRTLDSTVPSRKKKSSATSDAEPSELESTIHKSHDEPKYQMKRFSPTKDGADTEAKIQTGVSYYKSLTELVDRPERKVTSLSKQKSNDESVGQFNKPHMDEVSVEPDKDSTSFFDVPRVPNNSEVVDEIAPETVAVRSSHHDNLPEEPPQKPQTSIERLQQYMVDIELNEEPPLSQDPERNQREADEDVDLKDSDVEIGIENTVEMEQVDKLKPANEGGETISNGTEKRVTIEPKFTKKKYEINELPENNVLSLVTPPVKLIWNRNEQLKNKDSVKDALLKVPIVETAKASRKLDPYSDTSQKSDKIILRIKGKTSDSPNLIQDTLNVNKFKTSSPTHPRKNISSITNYIIHKPHPYDGTCRKFNPNILKLAEERSEYASKCSKIEESLDSSSLLSSEGEVKCKCKNISSGEVHSCPREKVKPSRIAPGIYSKDKISSHIVMEKERKHYQHWVTYYSTKKNKNESCSSSLASDSVNDN